MVNGETHYLWGRRYRLEAIESDTLKSQTIKLKSSKLILTVNTGLSDEVKLKLLTEYYRGRLKAKALDLIDKCSKKTGVTISDWQIQKMKTKWGSCNIEEGSIRLNLDLAKKPLLCLEYIILHELLHFKERQHNDRFKALLDTHMPDWRSRRIYSTKCH